MAGRVLRAGAVCAVLGGGAGRVRVRCAGVAADRCASGVRRAACRAGPRRERAAAVVDRRHPGLPHLQRQQPGAAGAAAWGLRQVDAGPAGELFRRRQRAVRRVAGPRWGAAVGPGAGTGCAGAAAVDWLRPGGAGDRRGRGRRAMAAAAAVLRDRHGERALRDRMQRLPGDTAWRRHRRGLGAAAGLAERDDPRRADGGRGGAGAFRRPGALRPGPRSRSSACCSRAATPPPPARAGSRVRRPRASSRPRRPRATAPPASRAARAPSRPAWRRGTPRRPAGCAPAPPRRARP
jgi:hypothetical protein